jgi:WD40 repeat protein
MAIWDVRTGQRVGDLAKRTDSAYGPTFSPDGRYVSTGGSNFDVSIRDANSLQPTGDPLVGHRTSASITFDAPSTHLLSTATDGIRLWDLGQRIEIGSPIRTAFGGNFTPDGRSFVFTDTQRVHVWDMDSEMWVAAACKAAGRNLSEGEWQTYGPSAPYHATCF